MFISSCLFLKNSKDILQPISLVAEIKIGNENYGYITDSVEVEELKEHIQNTINYSKKYLVLSREFLTDRSLYLWAQNVFYKKNKPFDVIIVLKTTDNSLTKGYQFKNCYPLSWSMVEAEGVLRSGYKESIKFNFEEVSIL